MSADKLSPEQAKAMSDEITERVRKTVRDVNEWIDAASNNLTPGQTWLFRGRVINLLAANHYAWILKTPEEIQEKFGISAE